MFQRLTYLSFFVLAACLLLTGAANAADTGLVGWWKLDEGTGTTVADSSGRGHNGMFAEGAPTWVEGKFGKALQFDGKNKVEIPDHPDFHMQDAITIALWAKPEASEPEYAKLFIKQRSNEYPYGIQYTGNAQSIRATVNASARFDGSNTPNFPGEWGHLCMTYDGSALLLYKNGEEVSRLAASGKIQQNDLSLSIGGRLESTQNFIGVIDDVRLYNRALTPAEIKKVMERPPVGVASRPAPNAEAEDVARDVVLSWVPGELTAAVNGHVVYFSKSLRDVTDGIGGITQSAAIYAPAQRLDFETTYYWRVDEVSAPPDSTVFRGDIWSFTTEPVGYPIAGAHITATASSVGDATFGPENTINGSGLDANDLHSTVATDMWLSGNEPLGAWIQYEFDKLYKLHQMWVWNANQTYEGLFGFGMKNVSVEYSANGADWTALAMLSPFTKAPGTAGYAHDTTVDFGGAAAKYVRLTASTNWGGILPQYGLSEVRFFYIPVMAREPSPDRGATGVGVDGALSWRAGREAAAHRVYLSTDQQAVIDGTVPAVNVASTSYSSPLDLASTYYWRIDEVNEAQTPAAWQGDVWDFTAEEFIVVEDFEDYNDYPPNEIYSTWLDGYSDPANGSQVGNLTPPLAETKIVHGGKQSMPLFYANTGGATYSEGKRIFAIPQDWTKHAVRTLGLYFFGTAGNTGQLYVKINSTKIPYDGQAGNLARAGWQPWNIDLTAAGLNLQSVSSLAIGIDGNGASGTFYFDDIRLYSYERQFITPITPNDAALIGHWKFDGNMQDSSGLGNHGTAGGDPTFVAGKTGQAVDLDGSDYVAIDGLAGDLTTTTFTISAWIKTTQTNAGNVVASNDSASGHAFILGVDQGLVLVEANTSNRYPPLVNDNQWHFIAYVRDGNIAYVYVDGYLVGREIPSGDPTGQVRWSIGQEWDSANSSTPSDFYTGLVDDVRIYNYALSHAEAAWLAGRTEGFEKPF